MNAGRDRSRSREKQPNRSNIVKVFNIPEHSNKEDIIYFLWKSLEKAKGLTKPGSPVDIH